MKNINKNWEFCLLLLAKVQNTDDAYQPGRRKAEDAVSSDEYLYMSQCTVLKNYYSRLLDAAVFQQHGAPHHWAHEMWFLRSELGINWCSWGAPIPWPSSSLNLTLNYFTIGRTY